jgi:hypothetical protein
MIFKNRENKQENDQVLKIVLSGQLRNLRMQLIFTDKKSDIQFNGRVLK